MSDFAIFVTVKLKPGCLAAYMPLIQVDGESALEHEPGCKLFHMFTPEEGGDVVYLYEVYGSEEAFKAHQKSPHFTHYAKETEPLITERIIQRLAVLGP